MAIKVLLIEDKTLTRVGIRTAIADESDIDLIAETDNATEGYTLFKELKPDVTVLGLRLRDACSIDDLEKYLQRDPKAKIIMLAGHAGDAEISQALKKGSLGYICEDVEPETLIKAIRVVNAGRKFIPENIAQIIDDNLGSETLTPSEKHILRMLVGGMSIKEIGFASDISENTVKTHIKNIYDKIGVSGRTSATTTAIKRGLIKIDL